MILLHRLPDSNKYDSKTDGQTELNSTVIIDADISSTYQYPEHYSPMGMLCNFNGNANYTINKRK